MGHRNARRSNHGRAGPSKGGVDRAGKPIALGNTPKLAGKQASPDAPGVVKDIALALIKADADTQMRVETLDPTVVDDYARDMADGAEFPPVTLFFDGDAHWPGDGFHRIAAARRNGNSHVRAEVRQGTHRDAILFAVGANASHGLRRTAADKRRAVETMLRDPEWARWSDREIGKACAVDGKTVGKIRRELTTDGVSAEFRTERTYTTRHGTVATMETSAKATGTSVVDRMLLTVSDDALIRECRPWTRGGDMIRGYDDLKALAGATGCSIDSLLALSPANDPFYAGVPNRTEKAEWFAGIWDEFDFGDGVHLRRVHYVLISQRTPVLKPDGEPYQNTIADWKLLGSASLAARYLRLVPAESFIDRRNPEPLISAKQKAAQTFVGIISADCRLWTDLPEELDLPALYLSGFEPEQDFLVELWIEKSTMADVLEPLAARLGFNLVTGAGEMSETAARNAIGRAADAGKPTRILYVSDFDPAGRSMPVSVARKVEYLLQDAELDLDIALHPIALTPEQCEQFALPRAPIEKRGNGHADRFEEKFGAGATELDALEALHPGELAKIVSDEVGRYLDPTLAKRVTLAKFPFDRQLEEITEDVHELYTDEIAQIQERYEQFQTEAFKLESDAEELWCGLAETLSHEAPTITEDDIPRPRDADPPDEPLFDSKRSYLEQIDSYRTWRDGTA